MCSSGVCACLFVPQANTTATGTEGAEDSLNKAAARDADLGASTDHFIVVSSTLVEEVAQSTATTKATATAPRPDPTAANAHQWRQIAWADLKDARAAASALAAAKSDATTTKDDLEQLTAAASLAAQKAAS